MQVIREKLNYMLGESRSRVTGDFGVPGRGRHWWLLTWRRLMRGRVKRRYWSVVITRNPQLHSYLHKNYSRGLSAIVAGMEPEWRRLVHSLGENLSVLFGRCPAEPGICFQVIGSRHCWRDEGEYDCVILDTPPVGILADALTMVNKRTLVCVSFA